MPRPAYTLSLSGAAPRAGTSALPMARTSTERRSPFMASRPKSCRLRRRSAPNGRRRAALATARSHVFLLGGCAPQVGVPHPRIAADLAGRALHDETAEV